MFNIWPLQWDCSVVVFQCLRRRCWSLNKRATTVSSRLFARKGYVTKSWKCSSNQSLWFRIAEVYFWSCVERLWKFTVFKKSRRPTAQAELSFIFNLLLALQAKCWSDRGRVTIFPQRMLKFPRYSTVATTSAIYAWFSGMFGTMFLICFMHRYGDYKTIAGWNWSRENDVEEIYYFLNTCWGIFFKQGFPFALFFQMWPLVLPAPSELEYLLSEMFILSVLCCGQTRRKRSETSCKITLIQNYLLDRWLVFENRLYWNYISVFLTSWPVFWNSILRSVRRCNWYVTQRNLVSCPEVPQTLTLNKPYFLFVTFILI